MRRVLLLVMEGVSAAEPLSTLVLLVAPVLLGLSDVSLVAELGHLLCLSEELLGLVRISLLD